MLSDRQTVCFIVLIGTLLNVYITLFINQSFRNLQLAEIKTTVFNGTNNALYQSSLKTYKSKNTSLSRMINKNLSGAINSTGESLLQNVQLPLTIQSNVYLTKNPNICKGVEKMLFLLIVHSATGNFERRKALRETWANIELFSSQNIRVIFLLGMTNNDKTQRLITKENCCYGDIVQGDFIDAYSNLTHKAVLGLRWVAENCARAKFVVKVDDDVLVNPFKLVSEILKNNAYKSRTILCDLRVNDTIHRSGTKWIVDPHQFPGMVFWPFPYCAGMFVVITADIIPELYEQAKTSEFLWLDDVYVYGLLAHNIGNVTHIDMQKNASIYQDTVLKCFHSKGENCHLIGGVTSSVTNLRRFWKIIVDHRAMYTNLTINIKPAQRCQL